METPINPVLTFLVTFLGGVIGAWGGSYLREKGKNLATKEDIEPITQKIESVKVELGSRLYVHQFRYQKEFQILEELAEVTFELHGASQKLYSVGPSVETISEESEEKKKARRLDRYWKARDEFVRVTEVRRPFFPEEIYKLLSKLESRSKMRAFDYQDLNLDNVSHVKDAIKYFAKDTELIDQITQEIWDAIRKRVKEWESLFPEESSSLIS